jgi:hypothetical protein
MAFPQVIAETPGSTAGVDATSLVAPLPDGSNISGRRVLIAVGADGPTSGSLLFTIDAPAGWDAVLATTAGSGDDVAFAVYERIIDGTEGFDGTGDTITFNLTGTGNSQHITSQAWLLSDHDAAESSEVAVAVGADTAPDSPNLIPSLGARDYLWITIYNKDRGDNSTSAYPTNYTGTGSQSSSTGSTNSTANLMGWGRRELNAASENPGAFTIPGLAEEWIAATIAVPGTVGGGSAIAAISAAHRRRLNWL